jgi:hypothetical protein
MFTRTWDRMLGVVGRRPARVHVVEGDPLLLKTTPNWGTVEVKVLDPSSVVLFNSPKMPGVTHVIEVKVTHTTASGPKKLVMWLKTWFKEKPAPARAAKLTEEISKALKSSTTSDMEAAASRIKRLVRDEYQAGDTWFHIDLEGAGSVTVVEARPPTGLMRRG